MATTAVQDRYTGDLARIKEICNIDPEDTSRDTRISLLIEEAKQVADRFLGNPFQDANGNDLPLPEAVELGVTQFITDFVDVIKSNVASMNIANVRVSYNRNLRTTGLVQDFPEYTAINARAETHWLPYRRRKLFFSISASNVRTVPGL